MNSKQRKTPRWAKKPNESVRVISLRVPQKVHTAIATAAKRQGQSINGWATDVLRRAARA